MRCVRERQRGAIGETRAKNECRLTYDDDDDVRPTQQKGQRTRTRQLSFYTHTHIIVFHSRIARTHHSVGERGAGYVLGWFCVLVFCVLTAATNHQAGLLTFIVRVQKRNIETKATCRRRRRRRRRILCIKTCVLLFVMLKCYYNQLFQCELVRVVQS